MAPPNISADFDFLDPDVNLVGLPVAELAQLRESEPIHWVDVPDGCGGFEDNGYWIVTKHADVKEVSRRSDVFSSWQNGAIPTMAQGDDARERRTAAQRHAQHGRPTPHPAAQDHLPRIHPPRGRSAGGGARTARPEHRQERGRRGFGRLRRAGVMRAAAAGDRRPARRAAGGPRQAVPLVQRDDRRRGSRSSPTSIRRSRRWN